MSAQRRLQPTIGERIGSLVTGVAGMAFDPVPINLMWQACAIQSLPQINIFNWLLAGGFPAAQFPACQPFEYAGAHVHRVGVERHGTGLFQGFERHDRSHHFHAVVGGGWLAAAELADAAAKDHFCAPAAGAWVTTAGTVGMYQNLFQVCRA